MAETSSTSTLENLIHARRIMVERGDATAIIVSNRFHLFRAMLLARFTGIEASYAEVFVDTYWPEDIVGHLRESRRSTSKRCAVFEAG
ncbi:MAG: YdcF family protein [Hydrogenibacillus schlegelii]|nr:YdcF family protein [Hydrogenibacillus schlegelii]